jgi:hypothetical protein
MNITSLCQCFRIRRVPLYNRLNYTTLTLIPGSSKYRCCQGRYTTGLEIKHIEYSKPRRRAQHNAILSKISLDSTNLKTCLRLHLNSHRFESYKHFWLVTNSLKFRVANRSVRFNDAQRMSLNPKSSISWVRISKLQP